MARFVEPTREQVIVWRKWVESRPPLVRDLARRFEPWSLYRLETTGHRVTVYSYSEDNTVTVDVLGRFNLVKFERRVFGISPHDLFPCELPASGEPLGVMMSEAETEAFIAQQRRKHRGGNP